MPRVLVARREHDCRYCGDTIEPGQKFTMRMTTGHEMLILCLACSGLMSKVCAWCQADMGEIEGKGETGTTHGICQECQVKYFPELYPGRTL